MNEGGQGASDSVSVTCVKYSPQDNMLAVALTDNTIAVYFKSLSGYEMKRLISVSLGGFVCKMDWSVDGHYLQGATNSQVSHKFARFCSEILLSQVQDARYRRKLTGYLFLVCTPLLAGLDLLGGAAQRAASAKHVAAA